MTKNIHVGVFCYTENMDKKLISKYIPLDKSWIIRMGILDIVNDYKDIEKFLDKQTNLGDDLIALKNVSKVWRTNKSIPVGESGTLYRLLRFANWKLGLNKKFIISGTLSNRSITSNKSIIDLSQKKLLNLDNNTSQWATAKVLLGDRERLKNPPYKLKVTYDAVKHWKGHRKSNKSWLPRYDETILNQAEAYLKILKGQKVKFKPEQAEDFCFAYVFGFISEKTGEKKWPSLRGHESDRIKEIKEMLMFAKNGKTVKSRDHRVVQAIAMWAKINNKKVNIVYSKSVNKSWPQFWEFLKKVK